MSLVQSQLMNVRLLLLINTQLIELHVLMVLGFYPGQLVQLQLPVSQPLRLNVMMVVVPQLSSNVQSLNNVQKRPHHIVVHLVHVLQLHGLVSLPTPLFAQLLLQLNVKLNPVRFVRHH
jgi:hypothetical protein